MSDAARQRIRQLVAAAPPLTETQRARILALLLPTEPRPAR